MYWGFGREITGGLLQADCNVPGMVNIDLHTDYFWLERHLLQGLSLRILGSERRRSGPGVEYLKSFTIVNILL